MKKLGGRFFALMDFLCAKNVGDEEGRGEGYL